MATDSHMNDAFPLYNHIDVRIANADGTSDALLAAIRNSSCFMYQSGMGWSPDGRVLAIPLKHFGQPERWVLHIISVKDGSAKELYSNSSGLGKPVWLPSGNALLLPRYDQAAHRSQIWTISYPNGEARRLTNDLSDYHVPLDIMLSITQKRSVLNRGRRVSLVIGPGAEAEGGRRDQSSRTDAHRRSISDVQIDR
jgi:hypothetical protein